VRKVRLAVCPVVASHPAPLSPMPPQSPALSPPDVAQLSIGKNLSPLTYTEIGLNEPLSGVLLELLNQAPDPWTNYQSTSHSATKGGFITQREIRKSWASIFRLSLVVIFPGKCWLTYRAFRCIHFSTQVVQLSRFPIENHVCPYYSYWESKWISWIWKHMARLDVDTASYLTHAPQCPRLSISYAMSPSLVMLLKSKVQSVWRFQTLNHFQIPKNFDS